MNNRILKLLNILPSEAVIVKKLFAVQFFLIAGSSFLFVTANAIFLSKLPIRELPAAFFITGLFLFLFNKLYHLAEHLLSNKQLLYSIILFSIFVTALLGIFDDVKYTWMPYILLVWYNVVYLLTGLVFWGLVATVFNVRESRRLFTIIGAGDIPAKILGYLSVSILAPYIGLPNMVWITVLLFIAAFWFSGKIFETQRIKSISHHPSHEKETHTKQKQTHKKEPGSALIRAIALLSLISFASLILIDFVFLAEVKTRYHTDIELAYFLGLFFAGGRVLAVFIKVLLSSRFINYAGLVGSLLLSPIVLLAFLAIVFAAHYYLPGMQILLYLYGIMALLTEILKATIQEPVFLVLFQPLKLNLRLKGHVIAKGYMLAASLTLTGGFLYLFLREGPVTTGITLLYVLLGMLTIWIISVFIVKNRYVQNLHSALQRGYLSGNTLFLDEKKTVDLLTHKALGENPSEAIFALDLLEKAGHKDIDVLYNSALNSNKPVLKRYVMQRIVESNRLQSIPNLLGLLQSEKDPTQVSELIQAIARLDDNNPVLLQFVDSKNDQCRNASIEGLLLSKSEVTRKTGIEKLTQLSNSAKTSDRIGAATIIGNTENSEFAVMLQSLLHDNDPAVVKAATLASGKCKAIQFIPGIVSMAEDADTRKESLIALASFNDDAIDYFKKHPDENHKSAYIRAAGNIQTEKSTQYLLNLIKGNEKYFSVIVTKLRNRQYESTESEREYLTAIIKSRLTEAVEILRLRSAFHKVSESNRCISALTQEVNSRIQDSLKLMPMVFADESVSRAIHTYLRQHHQSSNALEMLEMSIPKDLFHLLNKALDRSEHAVSGRQRESISEVLTEIISGRNIRFNDWTRAMAIQFAEEKQMADIKQILEKNQERLSPILAELCNS